MNKKLITLAVAGALASPMMAIAADAEPTPEHSFSYNVGAVSNYLFRGISQTHGNPAIQGGVDYAHSSGLYAGIWASNITWVKQWQGSGSTELDLYGGFKNAINDDWSYDLGLIHYHYPGQGGSTEGDVGVYGWLANPNTTEVYGAVTWKWLTMKYSHAISDHFIGWVGTNGHSSTRGSNYLELNAAFDLGDGWGVSGHIGHQKVKNVVAVPGFENANYTDWNIGVTKDVGFGVVGLLYSEANPAGNCNSAIGGSNVYCWGKDMDTAASHNFRDEAKGQWVLSFKKTF